MLLSSHLIQAALITTTVIAQNVWQGLRGKQWILEKNETDFPVGTELWFTPLANNPNQVHIPCRLRDKFPSQFLRWNFQVLAYTSNRWEIEIKGVLEDALKYFSTRVLDMNSFSRFLTLCHCFQSRVWLQSAADRLSCLWCFSVSLKRVDKLYLIMKSNLKK